MTVCRAATLRTFFFAIHAGAKELNQHRSASRLSRLETLVERFWDQDAMGLCNKGDSFTEEERFTVETFNSSVIFNGTRFAVSLPFKDNAPQLISNYQEAYQRLLTTEKGLRKHPMKRQASGRPLISMLSMDLPKS